MLSIGALIWVSVRPLLRLILCTACGFIITKADIFPPVAARGTAQILLHITMPSLMFSKIVPAFTSDNISALGPLVLVAFIYEALGLFLAWLVKQFFWVPHRFRYGILVAGCWSNVGDVPTAVVMSITGAAPFTPSRDQTIAVAYLAAFILVFFITLFPMGGSHLIAWDYRGPDVDDEEPRMSVPAKTRQSMKQLSLKLSAVRRRIVGKGRDKGDVMPSNEKSVRDCPDTEGKKDLEQGLDMTVAACDVDCDDQTREMDETTAEPQPKRRQKHVSFQGDTDVDGSTTVFLEHAASPWTPTANDGIPSRITSHSPSITQVESESATAFSHVRSPSRRVQFNLSPSEPASPKEDSSRLPESVGPSTTVQPRSRALHHRFLAYSRTIVASMLTVQTITIFVSLLIALVPTLKALFTPVENSPIPNAPDGQPPLAFILDTANFIGAASVPMGLICLGSALARLHVPRSQWRTLPLGAISALAIGKMILMPIIGVLIVQGMTNSGLIDSGNRVLRFVCIFLSCIPTATTQVYLTQVYSGTGDAATLSAFLIPQYALMFVTMTILSAYTLSLLF